jgi:quercetin dioxygenase-like cupin family protein
MAKTLRIWASEDGESHLEELDLRFEESDFIPSDPPMLLTSPAPASGYFVSRVPRGLELDWHTPPVRELAVYLSGEGEIEASDGTVGTIESGTILLVDYTTGKGHRTRVTGSDEVLVVIVTLPGGGSSP